MTVSKMIRTTLFSYKKKELGADYIEIFIRGWNFNSVYRIEKIAII